MKGATAIALLRPALEAAVEVARAGERATPPVAAPGSLRRYLTFAKLPDPALEVARRVLEADDEFRVRVAASVDEPAVGRAGWIFLIRPEGWEADFDRLLQEAAAAEIAAKDVRHERGAQRRLAGAEAALARADAVARSATAEAEAALADLHAERLAARALADEVDRLRDELDRLGADRAEAIRRLKSTEATVTARNAELKSARHEIRMLQAELAAAVGGAPVPAAPRPAADGSAAGATDTGSAAPDVDLAAIGTGLADAVSLLGRLQSVLAEVADVAGVEPGDIRRPLLAGSGDSTGVAQPPPDRRARGPRRVPLGLPPGVLDDAPEAGEHLVRVPGVLVLVDGYNISNAVWHGLAPGEQRRRLLDACEELHARVGVDLEVVFDGNGEGATVATDARSGIVARFTAEGVEADDVLLARVAEEPADRPVVVASSDRRVRDGARRRGGNVLGARQFLAVLRR